MPSVTHASIPSPFTPRTISSTRSNCSPFFTERHAAPMQKRSAPFMRAALAAASTWSTSINGSRSTGVSWCALCEQ